jgi:ATP:ADP antiporter, AAA family
MMALAGWLRRALPATTQERSAALWSFAYFFTLLAGYYVLRPVRDQMGIAGGVKSLPWLFTATFLSLLVAQPLYGELVARLPRVRFISIVYHFYCRAGQEAVRVHWRWWHRWSAAWSGPHDLAVSTARSG